MPMPSVNDLQTMYGDWNPQAYLQAQSNADLERQYRESEYGRQQELTKQEGLNTLFKQQDDPNRVQERVLTNRARELGNTGLEQGIESKGMQLERDRAMQQYNLNADQRKALMQVTDDELKQADQVIEQLRRSLDPEEQKRGQQLYEFTGAARALKQKQAEAMEMERYKQMQETGRSVERNQTTLRAAEISQAGQDRRFQPKTGGGADFWANYYKTRGAFKQYSMLISEIAKVRDSNPEEAAIMQRMADDLQPAAQAELGSPKPGAINAGEVANLPTNPLPQIAPPRGNLSNVPRGKGTKEDPIVLK